MDIVLMDYDRALRALRDDDCNAALRFCQQFAEKAFKHIISANPEQLAEDRLLLTTHSLVRLARRAEEILGCAYTREDYVHFRQLQSFYFDLNYPGERYEDMGRDETEPVLLWMKGFRAKLEAEAFWHFASQ